MARRSVVIAALSCLHRAVAVEPVSSNVLPAADLFAVKLNDIDGNAFSLKDHANKVMMITNVASA